MSNVFTADKVVITINGVDQTALLQNYEDKAGSQPASATVVLPSVSAYSASAGSYENKTAVIKVLKAGLADDPSNYKVILSGHVYRYMTSMVDDTVSLKVLDKRQLLNKDFIGRRHLGTDGLRVLGADVIFNKDGKGNKDIDTGVFLDPPVAPDFVYNKGNVDDAEDCENEDADFWTYGDILDWIWENYVDDIDKPTIKFGLDRGNDGSSYAGLEKEAEEINLFGSTVGEAIDQIFSRTQASWTLQYNVDGRDADNAQAVIFSRAIPLSTRTLSFGNPSSPTASASVDLTYPVQWDVERDNENVITDLYIIGGKTIKEITATPEDFYDPTTEKRIVPVPSPVQDYIFKGIDAGQDDPGTGIVLGVINWQNYQDSGEYYLHRFDHARYETHDCGKNIRRKDHAKPVLGGLLIMRDKTGAYVDYDSECATDEVGTDEQLAFQYVEGGSVDLDRAAVTALKNNNYDGSTPPEKWTHAIETELREYVVASGGTPPRGGVADSRTYRSVLRDEFSHKVRNEVEVSIPISLVWTINVQANSHSWVVTIPVELPVQPDFALSGSGTVTPYTNPPPFNPKMVLPEGVVDDAVEKLNRIKDIVGNEVGVVPSTIQASLPSWENVRVGEKLVTTPANAYGAQNTEVVLSVTFNGDNQQLGFYASNIVGPNAIALAGSFINARRNRKRLSRNR